MTRERQRIDAIKTILARKSSAQLREMVQANDQERWSAEAFAAAEEVLCDRAAGRAADPTAVTPSAMNCMNVVDTNDCCTYTKPDFGDLIDGAYEAA